MKPLLIVLTVISSLFTTASNANSFPINSEAALKAFQTRFASANQVNWSASNDLYKVSFAINEQQAVAYFDANGTFMGLTRNVVSTHLPLALQASLRSTYEDMWITDLFEFTTDGGVQYFVTLENADQKIVLKSNITGWHLFKKVRKA